MKKYLIIIVIPIVIILLNINILATNEGFYTKYSEDIKDKSIYIKNILNYFDDKEELDYFSEKEENHLKDVKQLIKDVSAIFFIILTIFAYLVLSSKNTRKAFFYGGSEQQPKLLFDFPVIDIFVFILTARHTVRSIGYDVKITFEARRKVYKFISPGVVRDFALF